MVTDVQMFETLTVRPEGLCPTRLSPGTLAEALLFYGCVRVDADVTLLRDLLSQIDTSIVVNLLRSNSLLLRPFTDVYGVQTYEAGTPSERHCVIRVSPQLEWPQRIHRAVSGTVSSDEASRIVDAIVPHIQPIWQQPETYADFSQIDWRSPVIPDFVTVILGYLAPGYRPPAPLVFNAYNAESMVTVETNIDFNEAAAFAPSAEQPRTKLSVANVLGGLGQLSRTELVTRSEPRLASQTPFLTAGFVDGDRPTS